MLLLCFGAIRCLVLDWLSLGVFGFNFVLCFKLDIFGGFGCDGVCFVVLRSVTFTLYFCWSVGLACLASYFADLRCLGLVSCNARLLLFPYWFVFCGFNACFSLSFVMGCSGWWCGVPAFVV